MEEDTQLPLVPQEESAAEAFARLDRRLALVLRTLESIAAERHSITVPDYGPTLDHMAGILADIGEQLAAFRAAPAMAITPETMAARIAKAAETARADDRAAIHQMKEEQRRTIAAMDRITGTARTKEAQQKRQRQWCAGWAAAAALFMMIVPGIGARALPASWHLPERMARRTMGEASLWDAGTRLMRAGNPDSWQAVTDAVQIVQDNREAITACRQTAAKTGKPAKCAITIDSPQT
jgi:hypothetical protein